MSRSNGQTRGVPRVVAVIGAGYVGLPTAATLASFGHSVTLAEREPTRLAALRRGIMPIVEAGLDDLVAERDVGGSAALHRLRHRCRQGRGVRLPLRGHAPERRRVGRPFVRRGGSQGDRTHAEAGRHRREQIDGARGVHHRRRAGHRALRHRRRLEPRVPPGRDGGARQPQPRSHRRRGGRPSGRGQSGRAVRGDGGAAHRHRRDDLRDDQVRVQRVPGDQAQLRERAGRTVRGGGGRRPRRPARPRLRQAHRLRVSAARPGLGRVLPAQGHPGAAPHRPGGRLRLLAAGRCHRLERRAAQPGHHEGGGGLRRQPWPARRSRCGA